MKDKVVIVTGASAGIGEALAHTLVQRGAKVILAARRESELEALATKLGPNARAVVADVSVRAENMKLVQAAIDAFGTLDVFVANAGRGITRTVSELTDDDVDQMITTNFKSVLYGIQSCLPQFKQQKRGQFIAVSSMLARLSFTNIRSAYSASKAAVNSLMSSLRVELKTEFPHIIATTVMPGVVATGFGTAALNGGLDSRQMPGAQPVEEVATVIADAIEMPRAEVYTRPQMRELQAKYYTADDVATIEAGFGMPPR